jgi:exodeoxyribonuclease VII large subunit
MVKKENIFTVSEVTKHIKNVIESNIPNLFVEGEISNFTKHRSGHIYFSIKDSKSTLKCVFFKSYNTYLQFLPKVGDQVICLGKITVFEKSGNYQLNVTRMYPTGIGELQIKYEELKRKLEEEGLFDEIHKKPIPQFPETIGVVTSETGAAIQDIRNVISRRYPCKIYLYPATVQGDKAPEEIIEAIRFFNIHKPVDILIVGRGGGSQEDLFCFNDEQLARVIFESEIPVISAVGHEIDFTIADFVADLRAPTPSAAAELAVPDSSELLKYIQALENKIRLNTINYISNQKLNLQQLDQSLQYYHPQNIIQNFQQRIDEASLRMNHSLQSYLISHRNKLLVLSNQLKELSPYDALKRGYSISRQKKKILNSIKKINTGENLEILLSDGSLDCKVESIKENETF